MKNAVVNKVNHGIKDEAFEAGGPADHYAGEDGLTERVMRASTLVVQLAEKGSEEQQERARALFETRVHALFDTFEVDREAIDKLTKINPGESAEPISYNSFHISLRNPDYVAPISTELRDEEGRIKGWSWDWTHAHGREFIDVTREQVLANPSLGTQLVINNQFHL